MTSFSPGDYVHVIQVLAGIKSVLTAILVIVFLIVLVLLVILRVKSEKSRQIIARYTTLFGIVAIVALAVGVFRAPRSPQILWVDQDPDNNAQSRRIMKEMGILKISQALSSDEALAMLDEDSYDLMITRVDCLPKSTEVKNNCVTDVNRPSPTTNYENGTDLVTEAIRKHNGIEVIIYDKWFAAAQTRDGSWTSKGVWATNQILTLLEWVGDARSTTGRDTFSFN